jgi:hypothetical protein
MLDITTISNISEKIYIPNKIQKLQTNTFETVSEITGTAIPAYLELKQTGTCSIFKPELIKYNDMNKTYLYDDSNIDELKDESNIDESNIDESNIDESTIDESSINESSTNETYTIESNISKLTNEITIKDLYDTRILLYVANKWVSYLNGYAFKVNQIDDYTWCSKDNFELLSKRFNISKNAIFEQQLSTNKNLNFTLSGCIDCLDYGENGITNVWEFKCVDELTQIHKLQLALYMYMLLDSPILYVGCPVKYLNNSKYVVQKIYKNGRVDIIDNAQTTKKAKIIKTTKSEVIPNYRFLLFNVLSNETLEIKADNININIKETLNTIVEILVNTKNEKQTKKSDEEFIHYVKSNF